ncbi:hypothetical protein VQ03_10880 [Methylobacterium tarhaniae]|uniref:PsiF repeat-containing protein n=1 Tax=Methylobacterium tarhaniae TaxID=1187852 RepID=A0A0J6VT19_9HYPH|nr:hypothetical protein [Methylobacterium tarhaniae]KMO42411.1 hypothetical protein VQ03_10880 [Methylobacterium tarhaniae]
MRHILLLLAVLAPSSLLAQSAPGSSDSDARQVCEAKADQSGITGGNRATFLLECEAGERLKRGSAPG